MKNILKTLETQLKEVEEQFNQMEQKRQALVQQGQQVQSQINVAVSEQARLQGEHRRIVKLQDDFKDEPKEK